MTDRSRSISSICARCIKVFVNLCSYSVVSVVVVVVCSLFLLFKFKITYCNFLYENKTFLTSVTSHFAFRYKKRIFSVGQKITAISSNGNAPLDAIQSTQF